MFPNDNGWFPSALQFAEELPPWLAVKEALQQHVDSGPIRRTARARRRACAMNFEKNGGWRMQGDAERGENKVSTIRGHLTHKHDISRWSPV